MYINYDSVRATPWARGRIRGIWPSSLPHFGGDPCGVWNIERALNNKSWS